MLKKLLSFLFLTAFFSGFSQIPDGYYDAATGSGYTLKTQLKVIITNGHTDQGYGALYNAYINTDTDTFFENDNTVLDMYSENPLGVDTYNYVHNSNVCESTGPSSENDCYNREHIFPQGFFNSLLPMRSDIHHLVPSDGFVNSKRANFPFGEVASPTWTSSNGSKVGPNTFDTYSGTVFEPIDEFKGDIARMLLYFATRYEDEVTDNTWDDHTTANNPLNGTNNQVYEDWYLRLLYQWHTDDPVSNREVARNNEAYSFQGNRNPFIDHPEYVLMIWSSVLSVEHVNSKEKITVFPNPSHTGTVSLQVPNGWEIDSISLYSILGKNVFTARYPVITDNTFTIANVKSGVYLLKINSDRQNMIKKVAVY